MGWVKSEIVVGDRVAVLRIPLRRGGVNFHREISELSAMPDKLEARLREAIESSKPELIGCDIISMVFNGPTGCWEILVSHASFPRRILGCEVQRYDLFDDAPG